MGKVTVGCVIDESYVALGPRSTAVSVVEWAEA